MLESFRENCLILNINVILKSLWLIKWNVNTRGPSVINIISSKTKQNKNQKQNKKNITLNVPDVKYKCHIFFFTFN